MSRERRQRYSTFADAGEDAVIEPFRFRTCTCIWVLARVVILTGLRCLQLLSQASAEEWPYGCFVRGCWNADRVPFHDSLEEIVHTSGNSGLTEQLRKAGKTIEATSINDYSLLNANRLIKTRGPTITLRSLPIRTRKYPS